MTLFRINRACSVNENCKKEVIDAKKFAKKVTCQKNIQKDIHTVVHFDLPKSTKKMINNTQHNYRNDSAQQNMPQYYRKKRWKCH